MRIYIACATTLAVTLWTHSVTAQVQETIVNQSAGSIGYDASNNQIYASVPFSAPSNANSLLPIDATSGAFGTAIPIGTRLGQVAVSSDNSYVYVVDNDGHGVQRYNVTNNSLDQNFNMPGSGEFFESVRQMYAVPGQPNALLIERGLPGFSPPAVASGVWVNGTELPSTVGHQLGIGGPDLLAMDPNGTTVIGYETTTPDHDITDSAIESNGLVQLFGNTHGLGSSSSITSIQEANGLLYDSLGQVFSVTTNFPLAGTFSTNGNFTIDASVNRLYSIEQIGSSEFVLVYNLTTLVQLGQLPITGIGTSSTSNLIRFGVDGLAFTTSNNQVVLIQAQLVPEPSSLVTGLIGALLLAICYSLRRRRQAFFSVASAA
jgi:hypothetical protein